MAAVSVLLVVLPFLPATSAIRSNHTAAPPLILAAYQAWHGLPNHLEPPPYLSTDPAVITRQIQAARAQGIGGFVVDWYGPAAGLHNDTDREFIDQATGELFHQASAHGFQIALMYDEQTIVESGRPVTDATALAINDLVYATRYLTSTAYLAVNQRPVLFVFPEDTVELHLRWPDIRAQLGISIALLDKDPNPTRPAHDAQFDGFFAWVQPCEEIGWRLDGTEWGDCYLKWFYNTMDDPPYAGKIVVGAVWPGFDDNRARWGLGRYIWRRCGETWRDTWRLADQYKPPFVLIATWNDIEEGSDIENGAGDCLAPSHSRTVSPGNQAVYNHTFSNTGKFTDTFMMEAHSSNAWPVALSHNSLLIPPHANLPVTVTLTIPLSATFGLGDALTVIATSALSATVRSSVTDTTTVVPWSVYLPLARRN